MKKKNPLTFRERFQEHGLYLVVECVGLQTSVVYKYRQSDKKAALSIDQMGLSEYSSW